MRDHTDDVGHEARLTSADHDYVGPELAHYLRSIGLPRNDCIDLALHQRDWHVLNRHIDQLRLGDVELFALEPSAQIDVVSTTLEVTDLLAFH
jgi:non-ribosomal peptide synthetase component F